MSSLDHLSLDPMASPSIAPSVQLALLHAQAAAPQNATPLTEAPQTQAQTQAQAQAQGEEREAVVPSADDPVVIDFAEPLIAGDYPPPISKPTVIQKKERKVDTLDLKSESAFPSLSSNSPRVPVTSGWSSAAAASRVKSQPSARRETRAAPASSVKKSTVAHITDVLELPANQQITNQAVKPLGFKSNADVIQQVKSKTGTSIMASTNRLGTSTFILQGTPADVEKAKRELVAGLVVKRTVELAVPSSTRRFIIGTKGKTLQMIEAKSGTRINIPPRKEEEETQQESDEEMVNITIVGDAVGIKMAQAEIELIVGEKTAKQTLKLDIFDSKYHLLLAGPHNETLTSLETSLGVKVQMPAIVTGHEVLVEGQVRETAVVLSGDKEKVQQAKQILEERYATLKKTTGTISFNLPKRQHKYFIGKNGSTLREIFDKSGCSVEVPLSSDSSEDITVRGDKDRVWDAHAICMKASNAIQVVVLDLAVIYPSVSNVHEHAKQVLKYLVHTDKLKKIEQQLEVEVGIPRSAQSEKKVSLEFVSKIEQNTMNAYQSTYSLCQSLTPAFFTTVEIEPHLYHYLVVRHGKQLQRIKTRYSVAILVPEDEQEKILVVYERKEGEEEESVKEAKTVLEAVTAEIKKIAADSSDFISTVINIPAKFHRSIMGPKGTTLNAIIGEDSTVVVRFGGATEDEVLVRGMSSEVKRVIGELNKVQGDVRHDDFANAYSADFEIPAAYSAHVIGKAGSNINKLKDDLGVRIDISDPSKTDNGETIVKSKKKDQKDQKVKVVIHGIRTNVEAAKERISAMVNNLADQVSLNLNVPKEFHRFLIGPSGRYVKKLEDKYSVHIRFPKSFSTEASEADIITIRGRKKEATSAKEELVELYDYEKEVQTKRKERDARIAEERRKRETDLAAKANEEKEKETKKSS
ncbi:hypothetical protein BDF14DRAFT_43201 [Spinellus fusiger]|nr:hypothetical protein BDF14DRAFT_43201 [Spinellus fusiger]